MKSTNRRGLIRLGLLGVASLPFLKFSKALAETCEVTKPTDDAVLNRMVKEDDAAAKRLDYVENVPEDFEHARYEKGQDCGNCRFYRSAQEKDNWAPCTMLANRYVPTCGWCRSYQPMPS